MPASLWRRTLVSCYLSLAISGLVVGEDPARGLEQELEEELAAAPRDGQRLGRRAEAPYCVAVRPWAS
jgi:hypothetical protein